MNTKNTTGRFGWGFLKKLVIAALSIELAIIIFAFALFHLIPARIYENWLAQKVMASSGLRVENASFTTAFPLAFKMEGLKVFDASGGEILRMDSLRAGVSALGLPDLRIDLEGQASGGQVEGTVKAGFFSSPSIEMEARGVGFASLPVLSAIGIKIDGAFDAVIKLKDESGCPKGFMKAQGVEFKDAQLSFRGFPLPIDSVDEAGLSAEFFNCGVRLDGIWLESPDLSARMKGAIKIASPVSNSPVDMTLELVPGEGLLKKEFLISLLSPYKKSANYYSIPVKGTLGSLSGAVSPMPSF